MRSAHGFTLIEVLVVMTIIGLVTAVAAIAMPSWDAALTSDARRFAARAAVAAQESILSGEPFGASIDERGYRFARYRDGQWRAIEDGSHLAPVLWSEGIAARLKRDGSTITARLEPDTATTLSTPAITFSPTGLITAFELMLMTDAGAAAVTGSADGHIRITRDAATRP
jgi:type II secretion system protein H